MCLIWGIPYLLIRVAVREITPAMLVFLRTAGSTLLLLPLAATHGELRSLLPRWRPLLAFTAAGNPIPWILLPGPERRGPSSLPPLVPPAPPLVGCALAAPTRRAR